MSKYYLLQKDAFSNFKVFIHNSHASSHFIVIIAITSLNEKKKNIKKIVQVFL